MRLGFPRSRFARFRLQIVLSCCLLFCVFHPLLLFAGGGGGEAWTWTGYRSLQQLVDNGSHGNESGAEAATGNIFTFFMDVWVNLWLFLANLFTGGGASSGPPVVARCETPARCGLFGLWYVSYHYNNSSLPGTTTTTTQRSCQETCTWTRPPADPPLLCGGECGTTTTTVAPTLSPAPTASAPPTASPVVPPERTFDVTLDMALVPLLDRGYFTEAAGHWERVITGDLPAVSTSNNRPTYSGCSYPEGGQVDDVYICARYGKDDGPGKTLAYAGPDGSRSGSRGLPYSGYISFDQDDVVMLQERGTFQNIVEHEMGHILGIGTRWAAMGITGSGENCPYTGSHANREYQSLTGCGAIPTELDGGSGTKCVHFDESCLTNELMTGYINRDGSNPLSRLTVAALEDLGYEVDYSAADSFTDATIPSQCRCGDRLRSLTGTRRQASEGSWQRQRQRQRQRGRGRKLSEEMKDYAIRQGRAFLLEQAQRVVELDPREEEDGDAPIFIGDEFVSVWVQDQDDGDIFSVTVWADDHGQP